MSIRCIHSQGSCVILEGGGGGGGWVKECELVSTEQQKESCL